MPMALMLVGAAILALVVGRNRRADLTFIPYVGAVVGGALGHRSGAVPVLGRVVDDPDRAGRRHFLSGAIPGRQHPDAEAGGQFGRAASCLADVRACRYLALLFGFVGMLVAVPVAAAIGVLARFAIEQLQGQPASTKGQDDRTPVLMAQSTDVLICPCASRHWGAKISLSPPAMPPPSA